MKTRKLLRAVVRQLPLLAALLVLPLLSSCYKDEHHIVTYETLFSKDLLEYVEPTVSYSSATGTKSEVLTNDILTNWDDDFDTFKHWTRSYNFKNSGHTTTMSLSFRQIKDVPETDDYFWYWADIRARSLNMEDGVANYQSSTDFGLLKNTFERLSRDDFAERIEKLVETGVSLTVTVDDNGHATFTKQPEE